MQIKHKKFYKQAFVAGSGSNYLLLTGQQNDELKFKLIDISQYQMINISMGGMFALAINSQNNLLVWGILNNITIKIPSILQCRNVTKIHCGWDHALILDNENNLFGLGRNKEKQLDNSKTEFYDTVIKLYKDIIVKFVLCGFRTSYISDDKKILGRGQNKNKQLGNSGVKQGWGVVGEIENIKKLQCGKKFFMALTNDKKVFGCGSNQYNVLQNNNKQVFSELQLINQNVDDISAGWSHVVLSTEGKLKTYGRNNFGQLGRQQQSQQNQITIQNKNLFNSLQNIVCGTQFTFAKIDNQVYGWGWNQHSNITSEKTQVIKTAIKIQVPFDCKNIITYGACTLILN